MTELKNRVASRLRIGSHRTQNLGFFLSSLYNHNKKWVLLTNAIEH